MLRIGLIQMQCEKAQIQQNMAAISGHLKEAAARGVDIIGFPEMSLTGYADPTKYPQAALDLHGPEVAQLLKLTEPYPLTALVGLIEKNPAGKPFITHLVLRQGELLGFYRKITIEDEEVEWFSPGQGVPVFQYGNLTYGIAICADIGNETVFAECARQGAKIVFELAAPGLYGEQATRNWASGYAWWEGECQTQLSKYTREYGIWVAVATQAGRTIDEDFPGGGYVFAPGGERLYSTAGWQPGAAYLALDFETNKVINLYG
jgi:(R)-amidase